MTELTIPAIQQLIAGGESETIEFKESFNDSALEAIGAFANAVGGLLFIGVKDSGGICGTQLGKKTIEDIANKIQEATDPRIQPSIATSIIKNKTILIIQVVKNTCIPVSVRGRFYKRSGKTKQRMSHEEIMQRMSESTGLSWDAQPEPGSSLSDLNMALVENFIETATTVGRRPIHDNTSVNNLLRKLELVNDDTPTRAAILLFGKNPRSFFPSAFLKIGRFRSPTLIIDDYEAHGPLTSQLYEAMMWFRNRLTTEFIITGNPQREVRWEYPLNAVREAVINILCHRDFIHGAHSQIRLYDDRLEFWNAGSLLSPLTTDILLQEHDSIPRNRKIAEVFYYMGLIEKWGSGTVRIADELRQLNMPEPKFFSEYGRFKLILNKEPMIATKEDSTDLSHRQTIAVKHIKEHGQITNATYQKVTGVSKRTATRDLSDLVSKKILSTDGSSRGRGKTYKLNNNS